MKYSIVQGRLLLYSAAALAALMLAACGGSEPRVVPNAPQPGYAPRPELSRPDLIQPALNTIRDRIQSYEGRLEEIRSIENSPNSMMIPHQKMERLGTCKSQLLDILTGYDSLQKRLLAETNMDAAQNMANNMLQQVNRQDMEFLEGDCGRMLAEMRNAPTVPEQAEADPSSVAAPPPPAFSAPDENIRVAYQAGDYPKVISLYNQNWIGTAIPAAPETTLLYSRALLKNYQVEEAQHALAALNTQLEQHEDPAASEVLRTLGDIAFSTISYREAQDYYSRQVRLPAGQSDSWTQRQLAVLQQQEATPEELAAFSGLVRKYLAYSPSRDGYTVPADAEKFLNDYPASRLVPNVNEIIQKTREQADALVSQGVLRAEQRAGASEQREASGAVPAAQQTPEEGAATPLSAEQIAARGQALKDQYDRGMAQMASRDYDGAIQTFNSLMGSSYDDQARQRAGEAVRLAADDRRQRAADLFVRASQTNDIGQRKKMLLESRSLLQEVQNKYAQAGLSDRVSRNLYSVEEALRAIDPGLLGGGGMAPNPGSGAPW